MEDRRIGFRLMKLDNKVKREVQKIINKISQIDPELKEITGANGRVIGFLLDNDDRDVFQRDIEEFFELRPSTVSANLKRMEKNGLIKRQYMEHDTRLKKVQLTKKAIELDKKLDKHIDEIEERLNSALTTEEQDTFLKLLAKLEKEFN